MRISNGRKRQEPEHLPSPREVRQLCLEIQRRWTERDRHRRTVTQTRGWSAPIVQISDLVGEGPGHWASTLD
jgi:hypothetical protein